jgi:5-methylcytosine-specific restriction endonuclease McrA
MSRIFKSKNKKIKLLRVYPFCTYCGIGLDVESATLDHMKPASKNGKGNISNLCLCCLNCNRLKDDLCFYDCKTLLDFLLENNAL